MKYLEKQDVVDILVGCTVLGTGGGGEPDIGLALVEEDFRLGRKFMLQDLNSFPDDAYAASPYVCGAISPETEAERKKYADLAVLSEPCPVLAFEKMEGYFGKPFQGVISTELGGANTAYALHIGALLGKEILDGDLAGRSVPALQHNTCHVAGVPIAPMALATKFGEVAIVTDVVDDYRAETLVRALAVVSQNMIGVVDHPASGSILKKAAIPGALTQAMEIGRIMRRAREKGDDPVRNIVESQRGKILFKGNVSSFDWKTEKGFTVGNVNLTGTGKYSSERYRIWFQNEHIISWRNGKVDVTVPDLICVLDSEGAPVTNPNYSEGQELSVFALPAPDFWKTPKGIETLGPASFGFNVEYQPI